LAQTRQTAQTAFNSGDYTKALSLWEGIINNYEQKGNQKECPVYTEAGIAAMKLNQIEKAENYLKQAAYGNLSNANTYLALSKLYKEKDNLSLELENLEIYDKKYPSGADIDYVNLRLFELYSEIDVYDKALNYWNKLKPETQSQLESLQNILIVYDELDMADKAVATAKSIFANDNENIAAYKWMANHYFWKAEERYQKEMNIYMKNKTRKQYSHLLRVIDEVTVDYKKALKYAKKLYKLEPVAENAKLLGNTYDRLNYKKEAEYYQKLGEK
jgi:tetratricopeptide (TPR) repeat protein